MRKLWRILKEHIAADFQWRYYLSIAVFLAASLTLNLIFDFEAIIDRHNGGFGRLAGYFLLYGFAYYGGLAITLFFNPAARPMASRKYLVLSLFGLLVLTLDSGFPYMALLLQRLQVDIRLYSWTQSVLSNAIGFLFVLLPLLLVYRFFPLPNGELYGLVARKYNFKPYFMLLLMMAPLIIAASFTEGFVSFYPTYRSSEAAEFLGSPAWFPPAVYEFFYGLDFFNVELLFRGFLIVGLSQFLGKDSIIPMVTTYCFLHFGKPVGEAISSIFGGYILGVLAYYTRGIWGGVIIHIGIAWMMELTAYLQKN